MVAADLRPKGPYNLELSARGANDATRSWKDGILDAELPSGRAVAWQHLDGRVTVRATTEEAFDEMRFCLGIDDDHSDFLRRFRTDPFLGAAIKRYHGLRPIRLGTVAQSLLRALCGQLIQASEARRIERVIIRATTERRRPRHHAPPTVADLTRLSPARLRQLGLHARRGATLARLCAWELERLREQPTQTVFDRLGRERGIGPWSIGVVCLEGLGRFERGLEGDLGLVKLLAEIRGRRVEGWETAELLEPYGEWAGLASVYMLAGYGKGLLPLQRAAA